LVIFFWIGPVGVTARSSFVHPHIPSCIPYFFLSSDYFACVALKILPTYGPMVALERVERNQTQVTYYATIGAFCALASLCSFCVPASGYRNRPEGPRLRSLPRPIVYLITSTQLQPLFSTYCILGVDCGLVRYDYRSSRPHRGALTLIRHRDRIESPRLSTQSHSRKTRSTVAVHCARTGKQRYVNFIIQSLQFLLRLFRF
jgi:hypothetical protein